MGGEVGEEGLTSDGLETTPPAEEVDVVAWELEVGAVAMRDAEDVPLPAEDVDPTTVATFGGGGEVEVVVEVIV